MGSLTVDDLARLARMKPLAKAASTGLGGKAYDGDALLAANDADLAALGIELGRGKPSGAGRTIWPLSDCPYSPDHTDGAYRIQYADGGLHVGCKHDRCKGKTIHAHPALFPGTMAAMPKGPTLRTGKSATPEPATGPPSPPRDPSELEPGYVVLNRVHAWIGRFVAYPSAHAHIAHTLWIAHTHFMQCWDSTPRIAFLSPEPGSGKSRALEVTGPLVPRPIEAVNMSAAALFRLVASGEGLPTVLYDEIDTVFGSKRAAEMHEDVRGLLNAGHRRGVKTYRSNQKGDILEYEAYSAVALAGLGDLPDTLLSRSVIVQMRRRAPGERIEPWRARIEEPAAHELRADLAEWAAAITDSIAWPEMPVGVEDRDADVWEPLLAVADVAGGEWPANARDAAKALVQAAKDTTPSLGIRLLGDIRTIFRWPNNADRDALFTDDLVKELCGLDESPWNEIASGKSLNVRGLASRLGKYGVKSRQIRIGTATRKGYHGEDLADAWARYLPPYVEKSETSETSETSGSSPHDSGGTVFRNADTEAKQGNGSETPNPRNSGNVSDVSHVSDLPQSEERAALGGLTPLRQRCVQCGAPAENGYLYCQQHGKAGDLPPTDTDADYVEII